MTEQVTCRVCGCLSALGTAECPDCGAPLPQELSRPKEIVSGETISPETISPETAAVEAAPKPRRGLFAKRPGLRRVALFVAVCLMAELAFLLLPQKRQPPGVALWWADQGLITPDGVWDYEAEGFVFADATSDGQYVLLQKFEGTDAQVKAKTQRGLVVYSAQVSSSYTYAPDGNYYLFDGRRLEAVDWEQADLNDNGVVFYTRTEENAAALYRRDLKTGRVHEVERLEGEGYWETLRPSDDGAAVIYRWAETSDADAADGEWTGDYRLWRVKDRETVTIDGGGVLWGIGTGGETCLFWKRDSERDGDLYGWDGESHYGTLRGYYDGYYLWRNGETVALPENMMMMWSNDALTEFIFREYRDDAAGDWYYFDVDAMRAPVRLDILNDSYFAIPGTGYGTYERKTLKGRFYETYSAGHDKLYYMTARGEPVPVEEEPMDRLVANRSGTRAVYRRDNDLYRAEVRLGDVPARERLTNTAGEDTSAYRSIGTVTVFAADEALEHIYYVTQGKNGKSLRYWHNGEDTLILEFEANYGTIPMTVTTTGGGCYFSYGGDVYYTEGGGEPRLLLEEAGTLAVPQLIGPEGWALLVGVRYESGENRQYYWRLNGYDAPVELTEWYPKEGKV